MVSLVTCIFQVSTTKCDALTLAMTVSLKQVQVYQFVKRLVWAFGRSSHSCYASVRLDPNACSFRYACNTFDCLPSY